MIYASNLQKKVDILNIELADEKKLSEKNKDVNKIISEKDSIIEILQNEINYYKNQFQKEKMNSNYQQFPLQFQIPFQQNDNVLNKKLDLLLENYSKENKKLKEKINKLKKQLKDNFNNKNNFETQINIQIDNFNNIISDYNEKLNNALSQIPELFNQDNKEGAAKYLVSQVNDFMSQNQKLIEENTRLLNQNNQLENELQYYKNLPYENNEEFEIENNKDESKSIIDLNQRVEDLENIIEKLRNENNYNQMINIQDNILNNNDENGMKDALMNTMNELREKEQIIENLKNQLKQTLSNQKIGGNKFDDINMFNKNIMYQNNNYKTFSAPPILKDDKDILNYLEEMFGEQNLNKDLYLRYRLGESGLINIDDLVKYRNLAHNNVSAEKILELIKDNKNFEKIELEGKTYIRINNFKEMKLLTIDEINNNKKSKKIYQFPYNNYYGPYMPNNYYIIYGGYLNQQQYENQYSPQEFNK